MDYYVSLVNVMDVYSTSEIVIDRLVICDCHNNTIIDICIIMCILYIDTVSCLSLSTLYFISLCIICVF